MYLFCDTEFTDFKTLGLISLGVISEDKKVHFYQEVSDVNISNCSDFVKETVLPLLDLREYGKKYEELCESFIEWLNKLPGKEIIIVADYSGDISIIKKIIESNNNINKNIIFKILNDAFYQATKERSIYSHNSINKAIEKMVQGIEDSLLKNPEQQHHALFDAIANCDGWNEGMKFLNN